MEGLPYINECTVGATTRPKTEHFCQGVDLFLSAPPESCLTLLEQGINVRQQTLQHKSFKYLLTAAQQADWPIIRELVGSSTLVEWSNYSRTPRSGNDRPRPHKLEEYQQ